MRAGLADFIGKNHEAIVSEWETFARTLLPAAGGMSKAGLRDHADDILTAIVADMTVPQSAAQKSAKSKGKARRNKAAGALGALGKLHAVLRIESGFTLQQVVAEYRSLRASVLQLWGKGSDPRGIGRFNETIDEALAEAVDRYTEKTSHYRDQVVGIVSHDLRNPLGGILLGAALLTRGTGLDDKDARVASNIHNSAKRMVRIVDDLVDLTRTRLGSQLSIVRGPTDVGPICEMVIAELAGSHPHAVFEYTHRGNLCGHLDKDRLAQVLSNILGNALQHGDEKQPIGIEARGRKKEIVIAIHNAGPPIPTRGQRDIFEPMVRLQVPGKASTGLGLGLYIAREVVTAHGGNIDVTSTAKEGTTFTVRLPRDEAAPFEAKRAKA